MRSPPRRIDVPESPVLAARAGGMNGPDAYNIALAVYRDLRLGRIGSRRKPSELPLTETESWFYGFANTKADQGSKNETGHAWIADRAVAAVVRTLARSGNRGKIAVKMKLN